MSQNAPNVVDVWPKSKKLGIERSDLLVMLSSGFLAILIILVLVDTSSLSELTSFSSFSIKSLAEDLISTTLSVYLSF